MLSTITERYREAGKNVWQRACDQNDANIEYILRTEGPFESLLDLGCDSGGRTMRYAAAACAKDVHGVEVVEERAKLAAERGIKVVAADLGAELPFDDESFDAVVSNQVIEHLYDTDIFVEEALRVLKPGGVVVTSTENLASWHNVAALVAGWQPFSLTNVSNQGAIGNPFGLQVGEEADYAKHVTLQHRRVFATRGLMDLHRAHGFTDVQCLGAGYYPLPRRIARIDPGHAAFITVVGRREAQPAAAAGKPAPIGSQGV